jgi:hypothetical protein
MFKLLLISVVVAPVFAGMAAARARSKRAPLLLGGLVLAYDALYFAMLHYLRYRWL